MLRFKSTEIKDHEFLEDNMPDNLINIPKCICSYKLRLLEHKDLHLRRIAFPFSKSVYFLQISLVGVILGILGVY